MDPTLLNGQFRRRFQPAPYVYSPRTDNWGGHHARKAYIPSVHIPPTPNPSLDDNHSGRQLELPSDTSSTGPLSIDSGSNNHFPYEQDSPLSTHNDASLFMSGMPHDERPQTSESYIGTSIDVPPTDVGISVPGSAEVQSIHIGSDLNFAEGYPDNPAHYLRLPEPNEDDNWSHSPISEDLIQDYQVQQMIENLNTQRQIIQLEYYPPAQNHAQNKAENADFDMNSANNAFSVVSQPPPGDHCSAYQPPYLQRVPQNQGFFSFSPTQQTVKFEPHASSTSNQRRGAKRLRSTSVDTSTANGLTPPPRAPSRHRQPRSVVGSEATTKAGEKRRTTEPRFTCNFCPSVFTRNHNLKNHMDTHKGQAGARCSKCSKSLAKSSLSRHEKKCRGS